MVDVWVKQRYARVLLAAGALVSSVAVAGLLLRWGGFTTTMSVFTVSLATLVGAGKFASA